MLSPPSTSPLFNSFAPGARIAFALGARIADDQVMTWTTPQITRTIAPLGALTGDERTLADAWLDLQRQTLLWKCGGLTAGQLKQRAIEPSRLSLLGLIRHMTEVERDWFRTRFAGQRPGYLYCSDDDLDAEFDVDSADAESDYAAYIREIETVRQLLRLHSLDEVYLDPRRNTDMTLRWVYTAMTIEYARHNGHADLLREQIDGGTGH